jgi:hypothetical protein
MADWKNPALLVAVVLVVLLLVMVAIEHSRSINARLVSVGNETITRRDLVNRLKIMGANDVLAQMAITNLMVIYARQKNITVTEQELRQFDQYNEIRAAFNDNTLDEYVSGLGITMEEWRSFNSDQIQLTKLIVPEEDIAEAVSMYAAEYTYPAWYRYRRFIILEEEKAKQAYDLLQQPDGAAEVAQMSISEPGSQPDGAKFFIDIPGAPASDHELVIEILKSLKAGQVSKPQQFPAQDGVQPWLIVQALDVHPQEKPTVANRGILIAKERLMGSNPKYAERQQEILTEAFQNIDMTFSPAIMEFSEAYERLKDLKSKSVYIPPATGAPVPGLPGIDDIERAMPQGPQPTPGDE